MDGLLARQRLFCLPFFIFVAPCLAFEEHSSRHHSAPLAELAPPASLATRLITNIQLQLKPAVEYVSLSASAFDLTTINLTQLNLASFTPQDWREHHYNLFTPPPHRYQLHLELKLSGSDEGKQRLSAYPSLLFTPQHALGRFSPRFNIEPLGLQTSLHFRGDGINLNFRPTAISTRLEFDLKITDDESRLDLTYRW